MPIAIDLTGQKFGRLEALNIVRRGSQRMWRCRCDCGNELAYPAGRLRVGDIKSCGCLRTERIIRIGHQNRTHGMSKTRLANIFGGMLKRCYNPNQKDYSGYGGKGVRICSSWLEDRSCFYQWALKNGYEDHLTIDRIDPAGNYEPENCRWITLSENASRARRARK